MKLIIGLGNPGKIYDNTRHNVGFMLLDYLAKGNFTEEKKFNSLYCELSLSEKVIFIKPLSFMNLSGDVVKRYVDYFKISLEDILVIQDDLDMEFGKIKFTYNHGDGGHNGIKDITNKLNSKSYLRLKIGISNNKLLDTKDYVLGKFSLSESKELKELFLSLDNLVEDFIKLPQDKLFNKYNSKKNVKKEEIQ